MRRALPGARGACTSRAMRIIFAALLLLLPLLGGCVSDAEDRAFFSSGWLRPERGADERLDRR